MKSVATLFGLAWFAATTTFVVESSSLRTSNQSKSIANRDNNANHNNANSINSQQQQPPSIDDTTTSNTLRHNRQRRQLEQGTECIVWKDMIMFEDHQVEQWICEFSAQDAQNQLGSVQHLEIKAPASLMEGAVSGGSLLRTKSLVSLVGSNNPREAYNSGGRQREGNNNNVFSSGLPVSSAFIEEESSSSPLALVIDDETDFELVPLEETDVRHYKYRRRKLQNTRTTGAMETLVVRVIDGDGNTPVYSKSQMENFVFYDDSCLKTQFEACSYGNIQIIPTEKFGLSESVINLNIDLVADESDATFGERGMAEAAMTATYKYFGLDSTSQLREHFDQVLYCFPNGSLFGGGKEWIGFAPVNHFMSFYNDDWFESVTLQMHEVGHTLGLDHSGTDGDEYGDYSGLMGTSNRNNDGPSKCFNAAKSFQLGWYPYSMETIDPLALPNGQISFVLQGIDSYDPSRPNDEIVTLRLQYQGGSKENGIDYYIGYNHAGGINSGTEQFRNQVVLFEKKNTNGDIKGFNAEGKSMVLASLNANESYIWRVGDTWVTLRVKSIQGSYATIELNGGVGSSPTRPPSSKPPTRAPTNPPPTRAPTLSPTIPKTCTDFTLQLDTDIRAYETKWTLQSNDGLLVYKPSETFYSNDFYPAYECIPYNRCYTLVLFDSGGDGGATYRIILGEEEFLPTFTTTEFLEEYSFCLDESGRQVEPTSQPTPNPTLPPTNQPTNQPTTDNRIIQTDSPTTVPLQDPLTGITLSRFVHTGEAGEAVCEDLPGSTRFNIIFGKGDDALTGESDDKLFKQCAFFQNFGKANKRKFCNANARIRKSQQETLTKGSIVKVYSLCPNTCQACSDTCADETQRFTVGTKANRKCPFMERMARATQERFCRNKVVTLGNGDISLRDQCAKTCGLLGFGKCAGFL